MTLDEEAVELHRKVRGSYSVKNRHELSLVYTPGVGAVSREIHKHPESVWDLTGRSNRVAIITDGTAVLGLGDIGPFAALPVMEGKAALFKEFAGIDAVPICLNTKDPDEIVRIVTALAPSFGGINLEDISAPRCFDIEERLIETLDIPVMHDDQHGTAVVVLAGLINALKIVNKSIDKIKIMISGAGAAGTAVAKMLTAYGAKNILVANSKGLINIPGTLADGIKDADVFIGVSAPNIVTSEMVRSMAAQPIVFALANPVPEIMPDLAKVAGARIVATGRSDFPNQVNNALAFPGIFRGVLDARLSKITQEMKLNAALALANYIKHPDENHILPDLMDKDIVKAISQAIGKQQMNRGSR